VADASRSAGRVAQREVPELEGERTVRRGGHLVRNRALGRSRGRSGVDDADAKRPPRALFVADDLHVRLRQLHGPEGETSVRQLDVHELDRAHRRELLALCQVELLERDPSREHLPATRRERAAQMHARARVAQLGAQPRQGEVRRQRGRVQPVELEREVGSELRTEGHRRSLDSQRAHDALGMRSHRQRALPRKTEIVNDELVEHEDLTYGGRQRPIVEHHLDLLDAQLAERPRERCVVHIVRGRRYRRFLRGCSTRRIDHGELDPRERRRAGQRSAALEPQTGERSLGDLGDARAEHVDGERQLPQTARVTTVGREADLADFQLELRSLPSCRVARGQVRANLRVRIPDRTVRLQSEPREQRLELSEAQPPEPHRQIHGKAVVGDRSRSLQREALEYTGARERELELHRCTARTDTRCAHCPAQLEFSCPLPQAAQVNAKVARAQLDELERELCRQGPVQLDGALVIYRLRLVRRRPGREVEVEKESVDLHAIDADVTAHERAQIHFHEHVVERHEGCARIRFRHDDAARFERATREGDRQLLVAGRHTQSSCDTLDDPGLCGRKGHTHRDKQHHEHEQATRAAREETAATGHARFGGLTAQRLPSPSAGSASVAA